MLIHKQISIALNEEQKKSGSLNEDYIRQYQYVLVYSGNHLTKQYYFHSAVAPCSLTCEPIPQMRIKAL